VPNFVSFAASITHSTSLFDALGTEACAPEKKQQLLTDSSNRQYSLIYAVYLNNKEITHMICITTQLIHAFVLSRLDYSNSVLAGLPKSMTAPVQCVQNAAARFIQHMPDRASLFSEL